MGQLRKDLRTFIQAQPRSLKLKRLSLAPNIGGAHILGEL